MPKQFVVLMHERNIPRNRLSACAAPHIACQLTESYSSSDVIDSSALQGSFQTIGDTIALSVNIQQSGDRSFTFRFKACWTRQESVPQQAMPSRALSPRRQMVERSEGVESSEGVSTF